MEIDPDAVDTTGAADGSILIRPSREGPEEEPAVEPPVEVPPPPTEEAPPPPGPYTCTGTAPAPRSRRSLRRAETAR